MTDRSESQPSQPPERKLATILSADVAEFSRLMAEDEELTLLAFRERRKVFESLVTLHRGRVFNTAGDAPGGVQQRRRSGTVRNRNPGGAAHPQ